jgi:O-antigen/teichoic acid export membrane protein
MLEKAVLSVKGLFLAYVFANLLSKDVYGQYQYLLSIAGICTIFALPGMGTAIVRAVANGRVGSFKKAVMAMLYWSPLGSAALLLIGLYREFTFVGQQGFGTYVFLAAIFPLFVISSAWRYYCLGKELYRRFVKISFFLEAVTFLTAVVTVYFYPSVMTLLFSTLGLGSGLASVFVWKMSKESPENPYDQKDISYGKKISGIYAFSTLAGYFDRVVVGSFLGFADLAIYSIAIIFPEQIRTGTSVIMAVLLPKFSKNRDSNILRKNLLFAIGLSILLILGGSMLYLFISFPIFKFFFPQYMEAVSYSQALMFGMVTTPFLFVDSFFRGQGQDKAVAVATIGSSAVNVAVTAALIVFYGAFERGVLTGNFSVSKTISEKLKQSFRKESYP